MRISMETIWRAIIGRPSCERPMKFQRNRRCFNLSRLLCISLVVLIAFSGCYHWVPIGPGFGDGAVTKVDKVRIGGENGEELYNATVAWPLLTATKIVHPITFDLRKTPAEREVLSGGSTAAAILVPLAVIGLAVVIGGAALCGSHGGCVPGIH